jgi:hypothetical protein
MELCERIWRRVGPQLGTVGSRVRLETAAGQMIIIMIIIIIIRETRGSLAVAPFVVHYI